MLCKNSSLFVLMYFRVLFAFLRIFWLFCFVKKQFTIWIQNEYVSDELDLIFSLYTIHALLHIVHLSKTFQEGNYVTL